MTREERKKELMYVAGQWKIIGIGDYHDMKDKLYAFIDYYEKLINQCDSNPENVLLAQHREDYDYDSIKETLEELLTYVEACIEIHETTEELRDCIKNSNY